MEILPARVQDAALLARLESRQPQAAGWGKDGFAGEIGQPYALVYTAWQQGELAGFICARHAADTAEVLNVAVSPDWVRRGVGKTLLKACLEQLQDQGIKTVTLEVNEKNIPAVHLYAWGGFSVWGRRKKFYAEDDALLMGKNL